MIVIGQLSLNTALLLEETRTPLCFSDKLWQTI